MRKKSILLLIITMLTICVGCSTKKEVSPTSLYFEQPTVTTCSNDSNLNLQIRFLTNDMNFKVSNYQVKSSNKEVMVKDSKFSYSENDDNTLIINFNLDLTVPTGKSNFDLKFNVNDKEYILKDITHVNYNNNFKFDGVSQIFHSPYCPENGSISQYINEIELKNFDISNADFFILGEEINSVDKVSSNEVHITSTNNKPAIVGYACTVNGKTYCIGNSYHTEKLDMDKINSLKK